MSLDKYNELFQTACRFKDTNPYYSQQLMKKAEEEMTKFISKPTYTSSNNNQHYQYFSGGVPGTTNYSQSAFIGHGTPPGCMPGIW